LDRNDLSFLNGILHEDVLFTPKALLLAGKVVYIDKVLYKYRIREGSITNNASVKNRIQSHTKICNQLFLFGNTKLKSQIKKRLLFEYLYSRYVFLLQLIYQAKDKLVDFDETVSRTVKKIYSTKPVRARFYQNYTTDYLYKYYKPFIARRAEYINERIFAKFRQIYKYQIKKRLT